MRPPRGPVRPFQALREAGFLGTQIVALTAYVGLRIAFSSFDDALGARPDRQPMAAAPPAVRNAVRHGRPPATGTSAP
ncbi:MAG TPA: hypothetical protein VGD12_13430 [Blastococcus sp.]